MPRYISILRGINVGGKKKILMADLKAIYEKLGFSHVETYIQSGNVAFDTDEKASNAGLEEKIFQGIAAAYPFEVPVLVRSREEMEATLNNNPFEPSSEEDAKKLIYVTFLAEIPAEERIEILQQKSFLPDTYEIIGKDIFIKYAERYSKSKLTNNLLESKLKVSATTRNWRTTQKLWDMVS